jgi:hypothetical protein
MEEQQDKYCYHYTRKDEIYQTNLVEANKISRNQNQS